MQCAKGDGSHVGQPCTADANCVSGLICDWDNTGLCMLTGDGTLGSSCQTTKDCKTTTYPGLQCIAPTLGALGTCECGPNSAILSKCTDDSICVKGADPPASTWNDAAFPNATSATKERFTGPCLDVKSAWYKNNGGRCSKQAGVAMMAGNHDYDVICITAATWKDVKQDSYLQWCNV